MKVYPIFKRIFDVILSVIAVIFLIPIFILEYIIVRIFISDKVFFIQKRGGAEKFRAGMNRNSGYFLDLDFAPFRKILS